MEGFIEKLLLGLTTTVIGIGIVFAVLILLILIIVCQSYLLRGTTKSKDKLESSEASSAQLPAQAIVTKDAGIAKGDAKVSGVDDEETAAAIMAVVSHDSGTPLAHLRIKSIELVS